MKVQVTQDDIDNGACGSPYRCPVALAVRRAVGKLDRFYSTQVSVSSYHIVVEGLGHAAPGPQLEQWIWDFDSHRPVPPIEFDLELKHYPEFGTAR